MKSTFQLTGRVLYFSADTGTIDQQLAGDSISVASARPLRGNLSTDEITPTATMLVYDERLGRYPYVGFNADDRLPITEMHLKRVDLISP